MNNPIFAPFQGATTANEPVATSPAKKPRKAKAAKAEPQATPAAPAPSAAAPANDESHTKPKRVYKKRATKAAVNAGTLMVEAFDLMETIGKLRGNEQAGDAFLAILQQLQPLSAKDRRIIVEHVAKLIA